ncbi:MAG: hypothetical protein QMD65_01270 [Patescibacteria group bacterium]|nr:hypothetical protein [Patescibacteria group bacterium]
MNKFLNNKLIPPWFLMGIIILIFGSFVFIGYVYKKTENIQFSVEDRQTKKDHIILLNSNVTTLTDFEKKCESQKGRFNLVQVRGQNYAGCGYNGDVGQNKLCYFIDQSRNIQTENECNLCKYSFSCGEPNFPQNILLDNSQEKKTDINQCWCNHYEQLYLLPITSSQVRIFFDNMIVSTSSEQFGIKSLKENKPKKINVSLQAENGIVKAGEKYTISWQGSNIPDYSTIELHECTGEGCSGIASVPYKPQQYVWTVPKTEFPRSRYISLSIKEGTESKYRVTASGSSADHFFVINPAFPTKFLYDSDNIFPLANKNETYRLVWNLNAKDAQEPVYLHIVKWIDSGNSLVSLDAIRVNSNINFHDLIISEKFQESTQYIAILTKTPSISGKAWDDKLVDEITSYDTRVTFCVESCPPERGVDYN